MGRDRKRWESFVCLMTNWIRYNSLLTKEKEFFTKGGRWPSLLLLLSHFSGVRLCATPCTAAHQAPLSMGYSRQDYWSGVPLPSPHIKATSNWWVQPVQWDQKKNKRIDLGKFRKFWIKLSYINKWLKAVREFIKVTAHKIHTKISTDILSISWNILKTKRRHYVSYNCQKKFKPPIKKMLNIYKEIIL